MIRTAIIVGVEIRNLTQIIPLDYPKNIRNGTQKNSIALVEAILIVEVEKRVEIVKM